eukprot:CAMPEP_0176276144 /NCGR_PEP_ID=MMETSP0121_2-20121125/47603_1 /TAXON_ID=160619 /ORGANISM="Kryptoperidinium foliaceum, Strain CCMP 1326" /LENGTH=256 /DNA_ID=CAMNT_0017616389 /DNA_START=263 /DNA_END=1032 /DNA_ORIENTATION=+
MRALVARPSMVTASLPPLHQRLLQPIQALKHPTAGSGASALDGPLLVPHVVQAQALGHLHDGHRVWQVLLVGKHQEHAVLQVVVPHQPRDLIAGEAEALAVGAVDDVDQAMDALVDVARKGGALLLEPRVPRDQRHVLALDGLHGEAAAGTDAGEADALAVGAVDYIDQAVNALVDVAREGSALLLETGVPRDQRHVLALDRLHGEAARRERRRHVAELGQQCRLSGAARAHHEQPELLPAGIVVPKMRDRSSHCH